MSDGWLMDMGFIEGCSSCAHLHLFSDRSQYWDLPYQTAAACNP